MGLINIVGNRIGLIGADMEQSLGSRKTEREVGPAPSPAQDLRPGGRREGGTVPEIAGKMVDIQKHWLNGPCPEGELIDWYYEDPTDNPLGPTRDIVHLVVKCPDEIAGEGGGGLVPFGTGGRPGGKTIGFSRGRGSSYYPGWNALPSTEGGTPLTREQREILDNLDFSNCELGSSDVYSDTRHPFRRNAECFDGEKEEIARRLSYLFNVQLLNLYPGLKDCLRSEYSKLKWCCHSTFYHGAGPFPEDYNANWENFDEIDLIREDGKIRETIDKARNTGRVDLGTWFFYLGEGRSAYKSAFFLLSLLGSLCPLGNARNVSPWEAALFLDVFPRDMVCAFLQHIKDRDPVGWEAAMRNCEEGKGGNIYHGKYFAVDVCAGKLWYSYGAGAALEGTRVKDRYGNFIDLNGDLSCVR